MENREVLLRMIDVANALSCVAPDKLGNLADGMGGSYLGQLELTLGEIRDTYKVLAKNDPEYKHVSGLIDDAVTRSRSGLFLTVTLDDSGEVRHQQELEDDDPVCCDYWANWYGKSIGYPLDIEASNVRLGCADLTIEIAENPGTAVCWASKSYFYKTENFE